MKICITGSNGFIGSNLYKKLSKENICVGIDTINADTIADLRNPYDYQLIRILMEADIIIHCAANVGVTNFIENQALFLKNWEIDSKIINFCALHNKKLLYFSSSEIYGDNSNISHESEYQFSKETRANYALEKLFAERTIQAYLKSYIIIRPVNIAGPGQSPEKGVIPNFIRCALNNQTIQIYTKDSIIPRRSFLHISDFVYAINCLIQNFDMYKNKAYNIGSKIDYSIYDIAYTIIKYLRSKSIIELTQARKNDNIILQRKLKESFFDLIDYNLKDITEIIKDAVKYEIQK